MPGSVTSMLSAESAEQMIADSGNVIVEFIPVGEAHKLIGSEFDGSRPERLDEFCSNVDSAVRLVEPRKHALFFKYILTKITGNARAKLLVRSDILNWESAKEALIEYYGEERTLDFYVCQMFQEKQGYKETVASWGHRVDRMVTSFRIAALKNESVEAKKHQHRLIRKLSLACFIQGLKDDRVQTMVKSRGAQTVEQAMAIAREEEIVLISKQARNELTNRSRTAGFKKPDYKSWNQKRNDDSSYNRQANVKVICFQCKEEGHMARDCKKKPDIKKKNVECYNCRKPGHLARDCRSKKQDRPREKGWEVKTIYERDIVVQRERCGYCHKLGHLGIDCRVLKRDRQSRKTCTVCDRTGHSRNECMFGNRRTAKCFACNKPGHIARNCNKGNRKSDGNKKHVGRHPPCGWCNGTSHEASECWYGPDSGRVKKNSSRSSSISSRSSSRNSRGSWKSANPLN